MKNKIKIKIKSNLENDRPDKFIKRCASNQTSSPGNTGTITHATGQLSFTARTLGEQERIKVRDRDQKISGKVGNTKRL